MFDYKPERSMDILTADDLGSVSTDFEAFKAESKYEQNWKVTGRGSEDSS
jgi:hypothetical protein